MIFLCDIAGPLSLVAQFVDTNDRVAFRQTAHAFRVASKGLQWRTPTDAHIISTKPMVIWAKFQGWQWPTDGAALAIQVGSLGLLRMAVSDGCAVDVECMLEAAKRGNIRIMNWLMRRGLPMDARVLAIAAHAGQLDVLVWAWQQPKTHAEAPPYIPLWVCVAAGIHGHDGLTESALRAGTPVDSETIASIGRTVTVGTLRWMRRAGFKWDSRMCNCASEYGNLRLLQYAVAEGCPWDKRSAMLVAARNGRFGILAWIVRQGGRPNTTVAARVAASGHNDSLDMIKWLACHGCNLDWQVRRNAKLKGRQPTVLERF